jgi:hypothetical protein
MNYFYVLLYFLLSSLGPFARLALFAFFIFLIVLFDFKMFSPNRDAPKLYAEHRKSRAQMPTPLQMPTPSLLLIWTRNRRRKQNRNN